MRAMLRLLRFAPFELTECLKDGQASVILDAALGATRYNRIVKSSLDDGLRVLAEATDLAKSIQIELLLTFCARQGLARPTR